MIVPVSVLVSQKHCSALGKVKCKAGHLFQWHWKFVILAVVSGGDIDDSSPYEPVAPNRHPDAFRLASISSGMTGLILIEPMVVDQMKESTT